MSSDFSRSSSSPLKSGPRFQVVVVILRNAQQRNAVCPQFRDGGEDIVGFERDMLHAGAEQLRQEPRRLRPAGLRRVQDDPHRAIRRLHDLASHQAAGVQHVLRRHFVQMRAATNRTAARSAFPRNASTARCDRRRSGRHPPPLRLSASNSMSQTRASVARRIDEIDQAPAHAAHRREFPVLPDRPPAGTADRAVRARAAMWRPRRPPASPARRPRCHG